MSIKTRGICTENSNRDRSSSRFCHLEFVCERSCRSMRIREVLRSRAYEFVASCFPGRSRISSSSVRHSITSSTQSVPKVTWPVDGLRNSRRSTAHLYSLAPIAPLAPIHPARPTAAGGLNRSSPFALDRCGRDIGPASEGAIDSAIAPPSTSLTHKISDTPPDRPVLGAERSCRDAEKLF